MTPPLRGQRIEKARVRGPFVWGAVFRCCRTEVSEGNLEVEVSNFEVAVCEWEVEVSNFEVAVCELEVEVSNFEVEVCELAVEDCELEVEVGEFEVEDCGLAVGYLWGRSSFWELEKKVLQSKIELCYKISHQIRTDVDLPEVGFNDAARDGRLSVKLI